MARYKKRKDDNKWTICILRITLYDYEHGIKNKLRVFLLTFTAAGAPTKLDDVDTDRDRSSSSATPSSEPPSIESGKHTQKHFQATRRDHKLAKPRFDTRCRLMCFLAVLSS